MNSQLLLAFQGKNTRVPIWIMRQAGRFLSEYRVLREKHSLNDMFRDPSIATDVTLMPIKRYPMDGAILFADILTLPSGMGFEVDYVEGIGPVIANPITQPGDIERIHDFDHLNYIPQIIRQVKAELPEDVAMLGFAGSPFTVLTYLMRQNNKGDVNTVLDFVREHPQGYDAIMSLLTSNTIDYVNMQKNAGIEAFQIFDTWAGQLTHEQFRELVLPYVRRIFDGVDLSSIYYVKGCAHLLNAMEEADSDFLSVCESVRIGKTENLNNTIRGVQGNLSNELLLNGSENEILREAAEILTDAKEHHQKYIFNLGHGILPKTDPEKLKLLVDYVQQFEWLAVAK